jgi:multicomponent Na+:H+ antiporter subunit G
MNIVTIILITIALVIMLITFILMFRFKTFYKEILISANIDTVSMIFFMVGVCFSSPNKEFLLKVLLVLFLALITNPLSAHATARSAFISGYRPKKKVREDQ